MRGARDNEWLEETLAQLWYRHFPDVPQRNDVRIQFGRGARTRLGSIKWGRKPVQHPDGTLQKRSIITITGHFRDPAIPDDVVQGVIAHELVHYAHGFSSPNPQLYRHPHHGGVVDRELKKRGLGEILRSGNHWLKQHWAPYLRTHRT
ncbi:hypothetical protein HY375_02010 [Candidatus Berkelbacteria bacterium]|nr:hypothetical protein [Candidatus Berkelbacteria bacterium]